MALPIQAVSKRAAWKETLARRADGPNELTLTSPPGENLDLAREPALKHRLALLLFAAIFAGLGGSPVFAQNANHRLTAATSSNAAAENGGRPAVSHEPKEGGLTQEAAEITRLFGLPITNSMVVTWGPSTRNLGRFSRGATPLGDEVTPGQLAAGLPRSQATR